ncbi:MAG: 2-phospho-L-lactate transferase CofD family protein [Chloroflexaceae bacterium]|nr:2-phospho-L-lactate transferase CofD family protein [Chloroflexaceae bacterium]
MKTILRRLSSLVYLAQPLALTFVGIVFLSLGVAYLFIHIYYTAPMPDFVQILTLQFLDRPWRGVLLLLVGLVILGFGMWQLSGVVVIPRRNQDQSTGELVLGYQRAGPPQIAVLSGGAGMLVLASMGEQAERLTCITPVQDPVEYYYRASGLLTSPNVYYVVPTPIPARVYATLDDGTFIDVMHIYPNQDRLASRHVTALQLAAADDDGVGTGRRNGSATPDTVQPVVPGTLPLTRVARETLQEADAIVLGPGSLFESIIPNLLIDELRESIQQSKALKIYVCNLMTEPGLTTGFNVSEHIRQIKRYGGFTPDYVLVDAQRIDPTIRQIYAAANQVPVYLDPEEYEETVVLAGDDISRRHVMVEGSVVIETDLSGSVIQYTASLNNPTQSRAVQVLRHDQQKLTAAILALLKRR